MAISPRAILGTGGPGFHTDEASSALPDLAGLLPRETVATLASIAPGDVSSPRANPRADKEPPILPFEESLYSAMLVTGQWGQDLRHPALVLNGEFRVHRLPVAGSVVGRPASALDRRALAAELPAAKGTVRLDAPFSERMAALSVELRRMIRLVRRTAPASVWVGSLTRMLHATDYARTATSVFSRVGPLDLPYNSAAGGWNPVILGNGKLPNFTTYSELPMATCPGAGACGVPLRLTATTGRHAPATQWCYSFHAYRHVRPWERMFLSTLANTLDRELAIVRGGGGELPLSDVAGRARAGMLGLAHRVWPAHVVRCALAITEANRRERVQFLRLFVDGDINHPDDVAAWMDALRQAAPKRLVGYGYSKAWPSFLSVDAWYRAHGETWPDNYVLNMSSGSIYEGAQYADLRARVAALPITRGTFQALPYSKGHFARYLPELIEQARALKAYEAAHPGQRAVVPMPAYGGGGGFDPMRVRAFALLADAQSPADVEAAFDGTGYVPNIDWDRYRPLDPARVRWLAYQALFTFLANEPDFGARVRRELLLDEMPQTEANELRSYEDLQRAELRKALHDLRASPDVPKSVRDKTLALAAHEALWALDVGGSCPLVCGNCSDHPTDPSLGVHRCASKTTFKGKTITIGLH